MSLRRERNRINWEHHIARQKRSGLTIQAYSQREGFSSWSFYQHRKKLQQLTGVSASKSNDPPIRNPLFIPIGTLQGELPQISIHFKDGTRLELHVVPGAEHLDCIISTLQRNSGGG